MIAVVLMLFSMSNKQGEVKMSESMSNLEKLVLANALGEYLSNDITDELMDAYIADGDQEDVPVDFTVCEAYEYHPWHGIVELIEAKRFSLHEEIKSILNIVKTGITHEAINGNLDSDANTWDMQHLFEIGANSAT